jgi:tetratricopeptide (TPR) repeat protein
VSDEDQKQSRRARRRAERERAAEEPEQSPETDGEEAASEPALEAEAGEDPAQARAPSRAERRAARKKGGVEAGATEQIRDRNQRVRDQAAARRREKREREKAPLVRGLDANEMVDDALARATHGVTQWVRKHFTLLQWVIVIAIVGGIAWQVWSWRHGKTVAKASDVLMEGVSSELGRVGASPAADPDIVERRPTFETEEARLQAAAERYAGAVEQRKGSGTAWLAKLGLAGVLYDQGKYDEAIDAYEQVKGSELAKHDADVRLRAIEGVGLAQEAKGDREAALKSFRELENSDLLGFKSLGLFHQARLHHAQGETQRAKELIAQVQEQVGKERSEFKAASYLESATRELQAAIDPASATPAYTPDQMEALQKQIMEDPTKLQQMLEEMGRSVPKLPEMPPLDLELEPPPEAPQPPPESP